ncbi:Aldo/keto reductase [Xylariomycetidae sp. FL2044]|nr:Aldo/keto reductase [Xylariomycetidae sp. FL2044]
MMSRIPKLKLNDGNDIPMLGFGTGTAQMMAQDKKDVSKITSTAIQMGFVHIDCAEAYLNESAVAAGIRDSGVPRENLFITAKLVGNRKQDIKAAFAASLERLGLDYIDLCLIHVPILAGSPQRLQGMWANLEEVKDSGKVKSIGTSNFMQDDLDVILETARIPPAINQVEYHPYLQHEGLVEYHKQHNISIAAYSPLSALTAARPGPLDSMYGELASKYGVTESDVGLRWCIDQGIVTITTSSSEERLRGYISKTFSFKLSSEEIEAMAELGRQKHHQGIALSYMRATYQDAD